MYRSKSLWSGLDVSIRDEVNTVLTGDNGENSRGYIALHRELLLDSNKRKIECMQCSKRGYRTPGEFCDRCFGVGYLWKETPVKIYRWPGISRAGNRANFKRQEGAGYVELNTGVIYIAYDTPVKIGDRIMEVKLGLNGQPFFPYEYTASLDIVAYDVYRLDNGRVEYLRLSIVPENIEYFGQPLNYLNPRNEELP